MRAAASHTSARSSGGGGRRAQEPRRRIRPSLHGTGEARAAASPVRRIAGLGAAARYDRAGVFLRLGGVVRHGGVSGGRSALPRGGADPGGCSGSAIPGRGDADRPRRLRRPRRPSTPTPTVTEPPSLNNLTGDQIVAMATACGGLAAADPAIPGMLLRDLSAVGGRRPRLLRIDGAVRRDRRSGRARCGADRRRRDTSFSSPLQLIDPPCPAGRWSRSGPTTTTISSSPTPPSSRRSTMVSACARCFFTGSDAGAGSSPYAANRETGIRAAYDAVRGASGPWHDRTVQLRNGLTLTVTQPEGDSRVSILFLRLADGGVQRHRLSEHRIGRASTSSSPVTSPCSTPSTPTPR